MDSAEGLRCPKCGHVLPELATKNNTFECPYCGTRLRYSSLHMWICVLLGFFASLIIAQKIGLQAWAGILWLPVFLLCIFLFFLLTSFFVPLITIDTAGSPKRFHPLRTLPFFVITWIAVTLYMAAYGYFLGWAGVAMGASHQEIQESLDLWAIPLGFVNSAFIVTPDKPLVTDLGIIAANSYFWALA